jgi:hypothetical protein
MLPPLFIKGHLSLRIDDKVVEHIHQNISVFGVTGLPWGALDPSLYFGKRVQVQIRIPQATRAEDEVFSVPAFLLRESTTRGKTLVVRFDLDPESRGRIKQLISKFGHYPAEYIRKYPRIPADEALQIYPTRVLIRRAARILSDPPPWERIPESELHSPDRPLIADVRNLSPNGLLASTENQNALPLTPGTNIKIDFEPRGWFRSPVQVDGIICRTTDEIIPKTKQLVRYFGIKFTHLSPENRALFLDRLKDIVLEIQNREGKR